MTISRTAQCVALGLFGVGGCMEVTFRTPARIGKKCKEGLDELVEAGMLTCVKHRAGGHTYHATPEMGMPMRKYKALSPKNPGDIFPIVVPMVDGVPDHG